MSEMESRTLLEYEVGLEIGKRGAYLLSRYEHPEDWADGQTTGADMHTGRMVLQMSELQLGGQHPDAPDHDLALDRHRALTAWAQDSGLLRVVRVVAPFGRPAFLTAPAETFSGIVLPHLQKIEPAHFAL